MSDPFSADRAFHPAVLIRGVKSPIVASDLPEFYPQDEPVDFPGGQLVGEIQVAWPTDELRHAINLTLMVPFGRAVLPSITVGVGAIGELTVYSATVGLTGTDLKVVGGPPVFDLQAEAVQVLRDGMLRVARTAGDFANAEAAVDSISNAEIRDYAFSKIDLMFYALADLYVDVGADTPQVASEGGFNEIVFSQLIERFEINGIHARQFANSVYRSVLSYLRSGGEIRGAWGRVASVGQNIYMLLVVPQTDQYVDDEQVDLHFS